MSYELMWKFMTRCLFFEMKLYGEKNNLGNYEILSYFSFKKTLNFHFFFLNEQLTYV